MAGTATARSGAVRAERLVKLQMTTPPASSMSDAARRTRYRRTGSTTVARMSAAPAVTKATCSFKPCMAASFAALAGRRYQAKVTRGTLVM